MNQILLVFGHKKKIWICKQKPFVENHEHDQTSSETFQMNKEFYGKKKPK